MERFKGVIIRKYDSDIDGNVGARETIRVVNKDTGLDAQIYSDNGVTPLQNPFTANTDGEYSFYAANGNYTIELGSPVLKSEDVTLFDVNDFESFPEAPDDGSVYGRNGQAEEWEEVTEEAPEDGLPYVRRNGVWVAGNSVDGGSFPAKPGDIYISSSGAIDASRDLELNGQTVSSDDYPDLAGLPGFTVINDPVGIVPADLANPTIVPLTNVSRNFTFSCINKTKTKTIFGGGSGGYFGISNADENVINEFPIGSTSYTLGYIKPFGQDNFFISKSSSGGFIEGSGILYGIVDSNNYNYTDLRSIVGVTMYSAVSFAYNNDGSVIAVGVRSAGSELRYSIDSGSSFNSLASPSSSYPNIAQILFKDDEFYICCGDKSGFGDQLQIFEIYKTSDFVSFVDLTSNIPNAPLTFIYETDGTVFYVKSDAGSVNYYTFDFETYTSTTIPLQLSLMAGVPVFGTSTIIANSLEHISFDLGMTIETIGETVLETSGFFDGTYIYLCTSAKTLIRMQAELSSSFAIQLPNYTPNIAGAKYYVRGK